MTLWGIDFAIHSVKNDKTTFLSSIDARSGRKPGLTDIVESAFNTDR